MQSADKSLLCFWSRLPDFGSLHYYWAAPTNAGTLSLSAELGSDFSSVCLETMIRRREIVRKIEWLLIVIMSFSPLGSHALSGAVLCVGADGHVTIESALQARCATDTTVESEASTKSDHRIAHLSSGTAHCDDCVDLRIYSGSDKDFRAVSVAATNKPTSGFKSIVSAAPRDFEYSRPISDSTSIELASSSHLSVLSTVIFLT